MVKELKVIDSKHKSNQRSIVQYALAQVYRWLENKWHPNTLQNVQVNNRPRFHERLLISQGTPWKLWGKCSEYRPHMSGTEMLLALSWLADQLSARKQSMIQQKNWTACTASYNVHAPDSLWKFCELPYRPLNNQMPYMAPELCLWSSSCSLSNNYSI